MNTTTPSPTEALLAKAKEYFVPNYVPRPVVLERGRGARVWDLEGVEYIDFGTGISVTSLGHRDPDLMAALREQAEKLWHTSNIYYTAPAILLAEELASSCCGDKVFFCNSGAEANEAAIKLARKYASLNGPESKREIVSFQGSFHGRTLATVTATAQPKYHEGFGPLPKGFRYCPFNDIDALKQVVSAEHTCAIIVEPIQGEGGINPAQPGFLPALRELCDEVGALLISDEIQCGMSRTGHFWAHAWAGIEPDITTCAKALGGGLPIGALLSKHHVAEVLTPGTHGTTFGGNPVTCAVALAAVKKLRSAPLLDNVRRQGEAFMAALNELNAATGLFSEVRGQGLMIGAELIPQEHGNAGAMMNACREAGVLILQAGPNVLRFLPPLTLTDEERQAGMERLAAGLHRYRDRPQ